MENDNTFKTVLGVLKRRLNIRTLFILVLLLSVNSYAWFIYSTKVAGGMTAQVKAWNVLFQVGEEEIFQDINFNIRDIFPGMTNYADSITVTNRSDTNASFTFEINKANILGEEYIKSDVLSSKQILQILRENYPFKIMLSTSATQLLPNMDATFNISVVWPYESGDDTRDTFWGDKAYQYKLNNPQNPSISIDVTISAYQTT